MSFQSEIKSEFKKLFNELVKDLSNEERKKLKALLNENKALDDKVKLARKLIRKIKKEIK